MEEDREYLVPDYYRKFSCKMGKCRTACCDGWPVSFSLEDYFKLTSCECGEDLRRRMDMGIKVCLSPSPDRYAEIVPRYDGRCPMHRDDGKCAIQAELGESALSHVCRLYPRGVKTSPYKECALANSCEGVLELLFDIDEPLSFSKEKITIQPPPQGERTTVFNTFGREQEIRLWLIRQLQRREYPFPERLMLFGKSLQALEQVLDAKEAYALDKLLSGPFDGTPPSFEIGEEHLLYGIATMERFTEFLDDRSESLRGYGERALKYFGEYDNCYGNYANAKRRFEKQFPKWEVWVEHMLVNSMFFEQFPFQDRPIGLWNEFVAICAVYAILRFLSLGCATDNMSEYVDMCAAVFRLINHTSFDSYAAGALFGLGCTDPQKIYNIIAL